jgi:predicted O-linked N-acetylglucosamine transferase (SPINDLY family)
VTAPDEASIEQVAALLQADRVAEAALRCRQLLDRDPDCAPARNLLGVIAARQDDFESAAGHFARAVALDPAQAEHHRNLGFVERQRGRLAEAAAALGDALRLAPADVIVLQELGTVRRALGDVGAAAKCWQRLLAIAPDSLDTRYALAQVLRTLGRHAEALTQLRELARRSSDYPGIHRELAYELDRAGRFMEALHHYDLALAQRPTDANALAGRGALMSHLQWGEDAAASLRQAIVLEPGFVGAHSNLLLALNYTESSQAAIYRESLVFGQRHAAHLLPAAPQFACSREPGRRLRIGYVSADFRYHSVAYFLRRVLAAHDRSRVEVWCYSNVESPDGMTAELRSLADRWRPITGLGDEEAARQIRDDAIDVLVDLGGHTAGNRLLVFARKPAPVQCSWLGYPNTTGLAAIDYRITDAIADPPGEADALHTEKLVRLPHGFLCCEPFALPAAAMRPAAAAVTFGSFNALAKLTPEVVATWAAILRGVPGSRLILKADAFADHAICQRLADRFSRHGVAAQRLDFRARIADHARHLALYAEVDIALDSFPYNGTTTTIEALSMGVPVLTLLGNRHAGRVGASILHHAGLADWVAGTAGDYVGLAVARAADRATLAASRPAVRAAIVASPLTDAARFTTELEHAYRHMWTSWCAAP